MAVEAIRWFYRFREIEVELLPESTDTLIKFRKMGVTHTWEVENNSETTMNICCISGDWLHRHLEITIEVESKRDGIPPGRLCMSNRISRYTELFHREDGHTATCDFEGGFPIVYVRTYYNGDVLRIPYHYQHRHGVLEKRNAKGEILRRAEYDHGVLHGMWKTYNEKKLILRANYEQGLLVGEYCKVGPHTTEYVSNYEQGKICGYRAIVSSTNHHKLYEESHYMDGVRHGWTIHYYNEKGEPFLHNHQWCSYITLYDHGTLVSSEYIPGYGADGQPFFFSPHLEDINERRRK